MSTISHLQTPAMIISNAVCKAFMWVGLMDPKDCEDLQQQENLDSFLWFKLLFIPALGLIILALFLLEDSVSYSYSANASVATAGAPGAVPGPEGGAGGAAAITGAPRPTASSGSSPPGLFFRFCAVSFLFVSS